MAMFTTVALTVCDEHGIEDNEQMMCVPKQFKVKPPNSDNMFQRYKNGKNFNTKMLSPLNGRGVHEHHAQKCNVTCKIRGISKHTM